MPPYQYSPITSPFVGSIADTMQRPAQALAAAEIAKGNAWAQAAQGIGQAASGAIQQATDPRRQLEQQQVVANQRAQQFTGTVNQIIAKLTTQNPDGTRTLDRGQLQQAFAAQNVPLPMQEQTFKALDDVDKSIQSFNTARTDHLADLAHGVLQAGATPGALQFGMALAKANGVVTDQQLDPLVQAVANGADIKQLLTQIRSTSEKYKDVSKPVILPRPGSQLVSPTGDTLATAPQVPEKPVNVPPGGTLVDPNTGKPIFSAPAAPTSNEWKDVLLDGKPAKVFVDPKTKAVTTIGGQAIDNPDARIKPVPPASTIVNPQALSDVKETVAGMKDGTLPPQLPGRATKEYLATLAEAHRQGYDLQAAVTDWNATQKHIATMNGAQQTRLNQAINQLPDLLDSVDALAAKWKGGHFPILNKANLALAKNGAYGDDVASVATQLDAQIADVTSDLGVAYMGGNSPTDHALGLASKALNSEWDQKVLHDMVTLARKNVTIRQNSIKNTGVAGASPDNPYAKPDTKPTPAAAFKVGDVVMVGGKSIKITALHPDGTFDGDPVKK